MAAFKGTPMIVKFAILPAALLAAYAVSPFVALYQLDCAMRHSDAAALNSAIDWDQVRDGLKQDIADGITGDPAPQAQAAIDTAPAKPAAADDDLPPFGASFVSSMAGNVVDRNVTPEHLAETMKAWKQAGARPPQPRVDEARFVSPTEFAIAFRPTGEGEVRLRLDLVRHGLWPHWCITHAEIPPDMLEKSATHTS